MTIKVMPLDGWMKATWRLNDELDGFMRRPPRFHRPGVYVDGTECWFELEDGRAFAYNRETVLYRIEVLNAMEMNHRQVSALEAVARERMASKTQLQLLKLRRDGDQIREVGRNTTLHMIRNGMIARIKARKKR